MSAQINNIRPEFDREIVDIVDYVMNYEISSKVAYDTAHYCLLDTLGCGLEALEYPACKKLLGPVVPGTVVPNGVRVPGTQFQLDPVQAAFIAEQAGADGITVHLREDRRHITDRDVRILRQTLDTRMNLEMAVTEEMLAIAVETKPHFCCLVPEKRQEVTTEGGLDVAGQRDKMRDACKRLADAGIQVSLFIDADEEQIKAAAEVGAPFIEIHTGCYADAKTDAEQAQELARIAKAATFAASLGLKVNAGHGLTYHNVKAIAAIPEMHELNIGHAIIGRAVMTGLKDAVAEMKRLMLEARG